jgi:DNA invertase Pin-like site-specific DNA recombinase
MFIICLRSLTCDYSGLYRLHQVVTEPTMRQYVVYRRVSTDEQGKSGLGLEGQERDIQLFLGNYSDIPYEVVATFEDIGSGADNGRPELQKALALCRKTGAWLLVSKLDRLSRRMSLIATLLEDRALRICVASMPGADNFQLHIYAALAEKEREFISLRTKAALAAKKARGEKVGGFRAGALPKANIARKAQADAAAARVAGIIAPLRASGLTLQAIADQLNLQHMVGPQGGTWTATTVRRTLARTR